jgi:hypothetical protein
MRAIRLALVGPMATMSAACGGIGIGEIGIAPPPSMTATTLTAGWEQNFSFEWTATEQSQSSRKAAGYVYNKNGEYAINLRVLARAVDASGAVVAQRIVSVPGGVGGFGRAYFEVPNLPVTASYQVSIWDFAWFQADGKM